MDLEGFKKFNSKHYNFFLDIKSHIRPTKVKFIDWEALSIEPSIFWSKKLLNKYYDKIIWYPKDDFIYPSFCDIAKAEWTIEMISAYKNLINFDRLSENINVVFSSELIDEFINNWNWEKLSSNPSIIWNFEMISKYINFINWGELSKNPSLKVSNELLELYKHELNWVYLGSNLTFISQLELIEKYPDFVNWVMISSNDKLPWDEKLISKWENKLNWYSIGFNELLMKDISFFYKYMDKWFYYKTFKSISSNLSFPWTIDLIDKYKFEWDWESLCLNESIKWNKNSIRLFFDFINFGTTINHENGYRTFNLGLSYNSSIDWDLDLLLEFENKWNYEQLALNKSLWRFYNANIKTL